MKRKILSLLLSFILLGTLTLPALADGGAAPDMEDIIATENGCLPLTPDLFAEAETFSRWVPEGSVYTAEEKNAAYQAYLRELGGVMAAPPQLQPEPLAPCEEAVFDVNLLSLFSAPEMLRLFSAQNIEFAADADSYRETLRRTAPAAYLIYLDLYDELHGILMGEKTPTVGTITYDGKTKPCYTVMMNSLNASGYGSGTIRETFTRYYILAVSALIADCPLETGSLTGRIVWGSSGYQCYIKLEYYGDPVERSEELCDACGRFYSSFCAAGYGAAGADAAAQYRYIHDYLCARLRYNNDEYHNLLSGDASEDAHSAYGALCGLGSIGNDTGHVVCEGYTRAFKLLCQTVQLPCATVLGATRNKTNVGFASYSNHIWNAVPISGHWYAVDVTWDDSVDYDFSFETCTVNANTWEYTYFLDNRYFLAEYPEQYNHRANSQIKYASETFELSAPALYTAPVVYPDRDTATEWLTLTAAPKTSGAPLQWENIMKALQYSFGNGAVVLGNIPNVRVFLTADTEFSVQYRVRAGKHFSVFGVTGGEALRRSALCSGSLLYVEDGAALTLDSLLVSGAGAGATAPLIATQNAVRKQDGSGFVSRARLTLRDVTVSGNTGAAGVYTDGYCDVSGRVRMTGNVLPGGAPADLRLGENGWLYVSGSLCGNGDGSHLGLYADVNRCCGEMYAGCTAEDWAVLRADLVGSAVTPERDALRFGLRADCVLQLLTDENGAKSVICTNVMPEDVTLCGFCAAYGADGKMLDVQPLLCAGERCFSAESGVPNVCTVPTLRAGSEYRVFLLYAERCILLGSCAFAS